ncbi:hypothetical protein [Gardnerella sp. 2492-Sm]|uniref:hypothetical protein n=1 Tax=unclassified Gardnerella TaxID=2628112 RepID=UPI003D073A93
MVSVMGTMKEPFDENQSGRNENEKCGNEWACGMGNCGWQKEPPPQFPYRSREPLPAHEGVLPIGFVNSSVPYHIGVCFNSTDDEKLFLSLALRTCRIACVVADISRGRPVPKAMRDLLTPECSAKLKNMWSVLDNFFKEIEDSESRSRLRRFPAIPNMINGMMVSPNRFEGVVCVMVGVMRYWESLSLEYRHGAWICTYADLG